MKKTFILLSCMVSVHLVNAQIDMQAHVASDEGQAAYSAYKVNQNAYYKGSYTYNDICKLEGSNLFGVLNALMGQTSRVDENGFNYNALRYEYEDVDRDLNFAGKILGYYDGMSLSSDWNPNSNYNREHTWPQSKGADKNTCMGYDMQSVRPSNVKVNSDRGNTAYGESSGYYNPDDVSINNSYYKKSNNGTYRGDCARVILYDYLVYGEMGGKRNNLYNGEAQLLEKLGKSGVFENINVLIKWHMQDPPSLTEMVRNDGGEVYQGNRNPFIDYPEFAVQILKGELRTFEVSTNMQMQPAYRLVTTDGFVSYLRKPDGSHPQDVTVTGANYNYDATLGRLTVSKVTGNVSITTGEVTSLEQDAFQPFSSLTVSGNSLFLQDLVGVSVTIISMSGMIMYEQQCIYGDVTVQLPQGIYIIRIGQRVIKFAIL